MLTERRRRASDRQRRAIEEQRIANRVISADRRMLDLLDERAAGIAAQRFANALHERSGNPGSAAACNPGPRLLRDEALLQIVDEELAVRNAKNIRGETRVVGERAVAEHCFAQRAKVPIGAGADGKCPIASAECLIRHDRRMRISVAPRFASGDERALRDVDERRQRRREERDFDRCAFAGSFASDEQ